MARVDTRQIRDIANKAQREFQQILRTKRARPEVAELLERELFDTVGSLEPAGSEREMVEKYLRAYVFLGEPRKASKLSQQTQISLEWSDERDVVERGYRIIARGSVLNIGKDIEMNYDGIRQLGEMRELTGMEVPEDVHEYFLEVFSRLLSSRIHPAVRAYVKASNAVFSNEDADR